MPAGILALGLKAFAGVAYADAEPLLDEMLTCVQIAEEKITRAMLDSDVEDVATLLALRSEVIEVHVGFSVAASLSKWISEARAASSNTPTSPRSSGRSSRRGSPRSTK